MLLLHFLSGLSPDWSLVTAPHSGSILPAAASEWGWTRVSDLSGCSSHQYRPSSSLSCSPGDLERLCLGVWVWGRMRGHRWVVLTVFYVPLEQVTGAIHQSVFYTRALQGVRGGLAVLAGAAPVIRLYKYLLTLLTINLHFIPLCSAQHSETQLWTLIKTVLPRPVFIQAGVGGWDRELIYLSYWERGRAVLPVLVTRAASQWGPDNLKIVVFVKNIWSITKTIYGQIESIKCNMKLDIVELRVHHDLRAQFRLLYF